MVTKVLVTGARGVIGRAVVRALLDAGISVRALDRRRSTGQDAETTGRVEWLVGDTRDPDLVSRATRSVDAVMHLAAGASFLMYELNPVEETAATFTGFHNVLEAARLTGTPRVIYASTSAVYEGNSLPYREAMALDPPDLKALAKCFNEQLAAYYSARYGLTTIGLRPFSVYAPDEFEKGPYANVISLFAWAIAMGRSPIVWGDGAQTRDFIFVDDVARAFVAALKADMGSCALNVGTGRETSFNQIISLLSDCSGRTARPRYVDVPVSIYARRLCADTTTTAASLGFTARVPVEEGVRRVYSRVLQEVEVRGAQLSAMQDEAIRLALATSTSTGRVAG